MPDVAELRKQFHAAVQRQDWEATVETGQALHTQGDYGVPPGTYAFWMEVAAGRLGRLYEAVVYSTAGLQQVTPGSPLHARLLVNGMLSRIRYGAPSAALELAQVFKHYYPQFPPEGQALLGLVLYREATAHEDRGDLDSAIPAYKAAREALLQVGDAATAGLVSVDLAYAILSQGGPKAVEEAVRIHGAVDPNLLDPRGRFAYLFVAAQIAYSRERYEEAQQLVRQAHIAAGEVPDALVWERAALAFLHACITLSLGDRTKALAYALRAAAGFDQSHDQRRLDQCHRLISQLLGLSE